MKYNFKNITKKHKYEETHLLENLMDAFEIGIPCQSSLINLFYHSSNIIKNQATKILVTFCEVILLYVF